MSICSRAALVLLFLFLGRLCCQSADVEFVVGGYMQSEGGTWDPEASPLKNPFGVDFDSKGNMYVVELGGGRVHRIDNDGKLTRIAGDGSKSYKGDGGPAIDVHVPSVTEMIPPHPSDLASAAAQRRRARSSRSFAIAWYFSRIHSITCASGITARMTELAFRVQHQLR